jgi:hypothetical protein
MEFQCTATERVEAAEIRRAAGAVSVTPISAILDELKLNRPQALN